MTTDTTTDAQVIVDTAIASTTPEILDAQHVYSVVVPAGANLEVLDLERFHAQPSRKKGTVELRTGDSLAAYVQVHGKSAGGQGTDLYADVDTLRIVAVLNAHTGDAAGWGDHRADLTLRLTPEWRKWTARSGQLLDQVAFAEHVEDGLAEIVDPPGAEMLELAQTFQANTKVAFKSARRLADGQRQLTYEETIDARAGEKGNITIPDRFEIGVAPFEGAQAYKVGARLRFRIGDGNLRIGYVLDRPELVVRAAFDDVLVALETATGIAAYHGTPAE